jgi:cation:H+ antiporter
MVIIWLKFIVCTIVIFCCGKRVAYYGDSIAKKTGLGELWVGVILVSIATSLPEIFTGVGSSLLVDAPDLTVGNLFGANTYNLLNIAVLDGVHKGSPLLSSVSTGQLLTAALSLIPLSVAAVGIVLSSKVSGYSFFNLSLYSIAILGSYLISIRIIFKFEQDQKKRLKVLSTEEIKLPDTHTISLKRAFSLYGLFAAGIAGAGIWLAYIGDELAITLQVGHNFVGNLFLGLTTTLPEISVSIAALHLGAKEMALANMLGSNLFNMTIIFINDLLYQKAPLFNVLSSNHLCTSFVIILMTAIVIAALVLKPSKKTKVGISSYSLGLIIVFILGTVINFAIGSR